MVRRAPVLALLTGPAAHAGGYYYADSGVVAAGRGGAFVASADDTFAQYYNPAGLIRLERQQVDLGLSLVRQDLGYDALDEDGAPLGTVENEGGVFPVPQLGWGARIAEDWAVAFGVYTAFAPDLRYDPDGPQRYVLIDSIVWQGAIGPSVAWRLHDRVTLGLGAQSQFLVVGQTLDVTTNGTRDPRADIGVDVLARDWFAPSANLGALIEPVDGVVLGLAAQLPSSFTASGEMTVDFTGNSLEGFLEDPVLVDEAVGLQLTLPWVLRAGVAVYPRETAVVELAAVWQAWSSLDAITLRDIDLSVDPGFGAPLEVAPTLDLPAGYRDTISLRLGGSVDAHPNLTARAGAFWESGAQRKRDLQVGLYDPWKAGLSGGASVHVADERATLDLSGAYLFYPSAEVRASSLTQVNVQGGDALVVGNGDYRSSGWIVSSGLSFAFGRRHGD